MANIQPNVLNTLTKINQGKQRTHIFKVDFSHIDPKFVGDFKVHHPSQMERMRIGVLQSQLTGGVPPIDQMTDNLVHIISTLDTVVDERPEWFDVYSDELEYEILEAVYLEYRNWVDAFRNRNKKPNNGEDSGEHTSEV